MSVHAASSHWIPPTPQRGAQATRPWHTRLLQYSSYPLILGVNVGLAIYAVMAGLSLGPIMVWLGLGNLLGFGLLEWLIPYRRDWRPSGRDLLRDLEYMLSVAMFITVTQVLLGVIAVAIAPGGNDLPLWLAVPLAVALADLIAYGYHRLIHTNAWLWKEHGVHHAPDKINVYMGNVLHVIDVLASGLLTMIPLIALGFSAEAIFLANVISTVQGVGSHTNADVRLGALNWFIMGPEHHRLHHSIVVEEAGNYAGVLTLWDRLFGTFTWAPKRRPDAVGVSADQAFPDSHRYLASLVHPFVKTRTR